MKLGIFLPNWIGDVVMATPTLRALRRRYPSAQLIGIARPYVTEVLAGTHWLDEIVHYDPRGARKELRSWTLVQNLRERELDAVVLLTNSLRTGVLAWLSAAPERIGYARNLRGPLLTMRLRHRRKRGRWVPTPVLDDYLRLAYAVDCPTESKHLELATTPQDEGAADDVWQRFRLNDDVVVLNSGGAYGAAKLWPTDYFALLAQRIATDLHRPVLMICGPQEQALARQVIAMADHPRVVSLADVASSIGLSKACVRRAALMVTTDSGPRHFAAAFGVPVITLFGPTHIAWSETYYDRAIHLQREVPCGPCQQRTCPLGHLRCMRELTVDEVYAAIVAQLEHQRETHAA